MGLIKSLLVGASVLTLSACGGGGGGGGKSSSTAAVTLPKVTINSNNANDVATASTATALDSGSSANVANVLAGAESSIGNKESALRIAQTHTANLLIDKFILTNKATISSLSAAVVTEVCDAGGSIKISGSIKYPDVKLSSGDSLGIEASNCKFGNDDAVMNGSVNIVVTGGEKPFNTINTPYTSSYQYSVKVIYTNLSVSGAATASSSSYQYVIDGSANLNFDVNDLSPRSTTTLNGDVMTYAYTKEGKATKVSLKNFYQKVTTATNTETTEFKGDVHNTALNASFNIETTSPMVWSYSASALTSGSFKVTGDR